MRMNHQVSAKEAARQAAQDRLLVRSPACKRRLKRQERILRLGNPAIHSQGLPRDGQNRGFLSPKGGVATIAGTAESPTGCPPTNRQRLELFPIRLQAREDIPKIPTPPIVSNPLDEVVSNIAVGSLLGNNMRTRSQTLKGGLKDGVVVLSQSLGVVEGRETDPLLCNNEQDGSRGGWRGHGRGRGKKMDVNGSKSADSEDNVEAHRGRKGHCVKNKKNRKGVKKTVPMLRDIGTPPGWFPPAIEVEKQRSPRHLRSSVSMNLIFRLQNARHGLDRLVVGEPFGDMPDSLEGTCMEEEEAMETVMDCKETPGSGCESAERLRIIHEGKQPLADGGQSNNTRLRRDSLDWYNSCSDGGGCTHLGCNDNIQSAVALAIEDDMVTQVWVPCPLLGLSPAAGSTNMLLGEVMKEFKHIITDAMMYKVDFGGVLGILALEKDKCIPVSKGDGIGAVVPLEDDQHEVLMPIQDSTFTLQLPNYLEDAVDESEEDVADPEWEADFQDWQGNSDSGNSDWVLSDSGSEPEVVEDSVPIAPDLDFDSFGFDHRFAPQHWEDLSTTLLPDRIQFTGPTPGPVHCPTHHPVHVSHFFEPYWPLETLEKICDQTNAYAKQPRYSNPSKQNEGSKWEDVSPREIRCWLGVYVYMGLKKLPNIRLYWDRRSFFGCPLIKGTMRRAHFEQICRNIHLVDNSGLVIDKADVNYDKIAKVRWLLESFVQICKQVYNPERHICVDEIMIPHRGRRCAIKQYMPAKPVKYGIKVWCYATSKSRYVYDLEVYTGRKGESTEKDLGAKVVKSLVADLKGRGHVVVTDRFFTSPSLFDALLQQGFLATGTVLPNRKGMPPNLGKYSHVAGERGGIIVQMHRSRRMCAIVWFDRIPVFLLSTSVDPLAEGTLCFRWTRCEGRKAFHTSPILLEYQEMMRGVDLVDQCRMEYTAQLRTHKWWHRLLLFILDTSLGNAYVLYKIHALSCRQERVMSRIQFHYALAGWLCDSEVRVGRTSATFNRSDRRLHYSAKHEKLRAKCVICGRKQIRLCPGCGGAYMCEGSCYLKVHTIPKYAAKVLK